MTHKVRVRCKVVVELYVSSETWDKDTPVGEIHRQAALLGSEKITRLCKDYVTLIGKPTTEAVITEDNR